MSKVSDLQVVKLEDIAEIIMGQSPDSSSYNNYESGYPFLQGCGDFGEKVPNIKIYCDQPTKLVPKDTILISVRAPVGELNWADKEYCVGRGLSGITAKKANQLYLYYSLDFGKAQLKRVSQGTTFEAINSTDLKNFEIIDFPIDQQLKIVKILTTIDQLIEKTQALIDKHTEIKQGMMADLFTRGIDLTTGQLRPPIEQAPHLYIKTELGWVPKDWGIDLIDNVLEKIIDYRGKTPTKTETGIPLITAKNIRMGFVDPEPREYIATNAYDGWMTRGIPVAGDVLFTTEAPLANVAQIETNDKCAFAQRVIILRCNKRVKDNFLKYSLMNSAMRTRIFRKGSGSTVEGIKQSQFRKLEISFPIDIKEQILINRMLNKIKSKINSESNYLNKLKLEKQGLMHDLLTGKVSVN